VSVSFTSGEAVTTDPRSIVKDRRRSSANNANLHDIVKEIAAEEEAAGRAAGGGAGTNQPSANSTAALPLQKHLASALGPKILFLSSEQWNVAPKQACFRQAFVKKCHRENVFNIVVLGTNHQNFCDSHLLVRKELMSGNSKLGTIDPFANTDALNEVMHNFFVQACVGASYVSSTASSDDMRSSGTSVGDQQQQGSASAAAELEADSERLVGFLALGRTSAVLSQSTSTDSVASVNDANVHDVIHSMNHGLALSSRRRRGVSQRTAAFMAANFRDEAALPNAIDWTLAHWCNPNPTSRP